MKKFVKVLSLILVLSFVFSLAACNKQAAKIDGTWKYTVDFDKALKAAADSEEVKENETAEQALQFLDGPVGDLVKKMNITMNVELKQDNTFVGTLDENSLNQSFETLKAGLPEVMPSLMAAITGQSEEEIKTQLEKSGKSMDDTINQMMEKFDVETIVEDAKNKKYEGTYRFEDGKLYFAEKGEEIDTNAYLVVEVSGDTLKVTDIVGVEKAKDLKPMLPIEFKR